MGCLCSSTALSPEERKELDEAKKLDKIHREAQKTENRIIKILLLGPGESGKSTIFKQMQVIYEDGFDGSSRSTFKPVIRKNLVEGMQQLIRAAWMLGLTFEGEEEKNAARVLSDVSIVRATELADILRYLKCLWGKGPSVSDGGSPAIKEAYAKRNQFYLGDSSLYYFARMDIICSDEYNPSDDDILRARMKTTGIIEHVFTMEKINFKFVDVGGQRSERKKWVNCFDAVTAILFVVAISSYDQTLFEDETTNRMVEALNVFDQVVTNENFTKTPIILFLNKYDIFKEKLKRVPLSVCFKDYEAPDSKASEEDIEKHASEYVKEQFEKRVKGTSLIFPYFTVATDRDNVSKVWKACRAIILTNSLKVSGFEVQ